MFSKNINVDDILVPEVIKRDYKGYEFSFDMDYIRSLDCVSFFNICTIREIDQFVLKIADLVKKEISLSTFKEFPRDVFFEKYEKVKNLSKQSPCKDVFNKIENRIDEIFLSMCNDNIPIGFCHGDLTLSNILIRKNDKNIFLIDFLDSFIESPIIDMVKIRQDTKYMWTVSLYRGSIDKNKFSILMNHMDRMFEKEFMKYDFYNKFYTPFQIMNFLRILPYIKTKDQAKICENALIDITGAV
tara:strand:+ start:6584 stop:7312 length:729 start_codon:yes stop_codon:yes gene_type:complete